MSNDKDLKLFKVASTLNISKEEIVKFLALKGFEFNGKPTSMLSAEMYDAVIEKFSAQAKTVEKQREKIEKLKQSTSKRADASVSIQSKEQERLAEINQRKTEERLERERLENERNEKIRAERAEREAIENEKKEAQRAIRESALKVELKQQQLDDARSAIRQAIEEHRSAEEEALLAKNESADEGKEQEDASPQTPQQEGDATEHSESDQDEDSADGTKKKRKRKNNVVMTTEPGARPKLQGLTVLGKIEIPSANASKQGRTAKDRDGNTGGGGQRRDDRNNRDSNDRRSTSGNSRRDDRRPQQDDNKPAVIPTNLEIGSKARSVGLRTSDDEDTNTNRLKAKKLDKRGGTPMLATKKKETVADRNKKKGVKTPVSRESFSDADVDKAIRATLAGMDVDASARNRNKIKKLKKIEREEREVRRQEEIERESTILRVTEFLTTAELANFMDTTPAEIITKCFSLGLMVSINQRLDKDTIQLIADDYGFLVEFASDTEVIEFEDEVEDSPEDLVPRPPIVTIMGHVDHGKTSLLDHIREANVVAGEAGGITQHIGAYKVNLPNGKAIAFLDTPGHEAFTAMRARGAQVTDVVVLVVAADDNVMPQTLEAISHAQAANVPLVVAINKIDKEDAKPDNVRQQLANNGVLVEDWGGKYQCAEISAKKGINIDGLLEKILLESDLLELKSNPDRTARGTVIEAHVDKGKGNVATVMVQTGTLRVGDAYITGQFYGRVRALYDERGQRVEEAGPSTPVQVTGFDGLPQSGDILVVSNDDAALRDAAVQRQILRREQQLRQVRHITLDDISAQIQLGGVKELRLIIKTDVSGSLEALTDSLLKLSTAEVKINIIHRAVGTLSESDIMLAAASNAVIVGFQVQLPTSVRRIADRESVDVRLYSIIYDAINEIQLAMEGMLSPDMKEEIISRVEVRQVFKISKVGQVAGCYVVSGSISRNDKIRLLRNGFEIFKGTLQSLKHIKDDVKEMKSGFECGVVINGFNDYEEGDIIEGYKVTEVKRKLN